MAQRPSPTPPAFSVVIPVHDEAGNIRSLAAEIEVALRQVTSWETVWVDDGSSDDTASVLASLPSPHRFIHRSTRVGQSAALLAGFDECRAPWIGTLDGDGQNDPADLIRQLRVAEERRVDLVNGVRVRREDDWRRRVVSRVANHLRRALTGDTATDAGCSTRVFRRHLATRLPDFDGMHRFLPSIAVTLGFRVAEIPVRHRARVHGRSHYSVANRLLPATLGILRFRRWSRAGQLALTNRVTGR